MVSTVCSSTTSRVEVTVIFGRLTPMLGIYSHTQKFSFVNITTIMIIEW